MKKICKNCGYINVGETKPCPICQKSDWEDYNIYQIKKISTDESFLEAMIKLKEKDPIEYQLKLNQFKLQQEQKDEIEEKQQENQVHCPYCNSTNVKKITGTERAVSVGMLGLFSKKLNKSFKCKNCGGTF